MGAYEYWLGGGRRMIVGGESVVTPGRGRWIVGGECVVIPGATAAVLRPGVFDWEVAELVGHRCVVHGEGGVWLVEEVGGGGGGGRVEDKWRRGVVLEGV